MSIDFEMRIVNYLAVEECSVGDFVLVSMVIQVSLFGTLFGSGEIMLASSPLLAIVAGQRRIDGQCDEFDDYSCTRPATNEVYQV